MFWRKKPPPAELRTDLRCSFCNKSQRYVKKLVAGPQAYICDECVDICVDVIMHEAREKDTTPAILTLDTKCALCAIPLAADDALVVDERGLLCPGCVDAIQAALSAR